MHSRKLSTYFVLLIQQNNTVMIHLPQIIYLTLWFAGLLIEANRHGKKKEGEYNFWVSATSGVIVFALLYWGGFFDNLFN